MNTLSSLQELLSALNVARISRYLTVYYSEIDRGKIVRVESEVGFKHQVVPGESSSLTREEGFSTFRREIIGMIENRLG